VANVTCSIDLIRESLHVLMWPPRRVDRMSVRSPFTLASDKANRMRADSSPRPRNDYIQISIQHSVFSKNLN
jgi:hypothetical protein